MPPSPSSRVFMLSLLLLLLGAVATLQSEASTPFFEEDAQPVPPDLPPSPFAEAVQPKQQKQNEEIQVYVHPMPETIGVSPLSSWSSWLRTILQPKQQEQNEEAQAHAHPMPKTIGVSPLSSWSSWLRTIFINALGHPMATVRPATEANVAGKLAILVKNTSGKCILKPNVPSGYKQICSSALSSNQCDVYAMTCVWSPDSCQLKSGSPVGYKTLCESAKDAAACTALSLTCAWGQPTSPPSPPTPAPTPAVTCSGSLTGSECLAWQAFFDATGGGGCSRDDPCACTAGGGMTCQDGHITVMDLHRTGTSISGSIPDSISALTALEYLSLFQTGISGSIPDSISALTALTSLWLKHTGISGSIPDSISALTALDTLDLYYTSLSGRIPDSISAMTALDTLYLFGTSISGSIPQSFCSLDISICELSDQGSPTYACPLPSCTDKLTACSVTRCQ